MTQEPTTQEPATHVATTEAPTAQEPMKQDEAPHPPRNDTRKVMTILGVGLALAVGAAVFMATGTSSKPADSPAATAGATATTAARSAIAVATAAPNGVQGAAPAASSPHDMAGALRRDATAQCRAAQWDKCREDVDRAAQLDPEGDKIVQVQRLHRMAEQRGAN